VLPRGIPAVVILKVVAVVVNEDTSVVAGVSEELVDQIAV
jgi:hypothetical protein